MDIRADATRKVMLRSRAAGINAEATTRRRDRSPRGLLIIPLVVLLGVAVALGGLSAVMPIPASAPAVPPEVVEDEEGAVPWVYDTVDSGVFQRRLGSVYTR